MNEKIILAYSGGLDTTLAIPYLKKKYNFDVIALIADLGEDKDLHVLKQRAIDVGAIKCIVVDDKNTFAEEYLAPALRANALYEQVYPLISALSRPYIAKLLVDTAHRENAIAVSHGCTAKGNDQVRFDLSIHALDPSLKIIAPLRESPMSREEGLDTLKEMGISMPITTESPYSIDMNIWGRSCECGMLEDPWTTPPDDAYVLSADAKNAPDEPEEIVITFAQGIPTALNTKNMPFAALIAELNTIAGKHGIGRIDHVENRIVGIKSREIYEAPAALTLIKAHQALEGLCLMRDMAQYKALLEQKVATMIYDGFWFSPLFKSLDSFMRASQEYVSGKVRLRLYKGSAVVCGRKSTSSLYNINLATYNKDDNFDHSAAAGFIDIVKLPLVQQHRVQEEYKVN